MCWSRLRLALDGRPALPARILVRVEQSILPGLFIGAIILFEYLGVPYPTIEPLPTSPFQKQMAQDGEDYAVLDIPLDRSDTKRYLYYQTQHEKSTVQGRVARVPAEAYALFNRIPLLSAWQTHILGQAPARSRLAVAAAGRSKCALHHPAQGSHAAGSGDFAAQLFHPAPGLRGRSDRGILYGARGAACRSRSPTRSASSTVGPAVEGPDQPIRVRVRWTAAQPIERELAYRLELIDENGTAVISQTDRITPTTSSWQPGTIVMGDYQLTPQQPVPIGQYRLQLSVLDGERVLGSIDLPHRIVNVPSGDGAWMSGQRGAARALWRGDRIARRRCEPPGQLADPVAALARAARARRGYEILRASARRAGQRRGAGRWHSRQVHAPQFASGRPTK